MANYDSIIIGAGHNGLICAAYLAQKQQKVLVVEASDVVGGLAGAREFHPGFRASVAHRVSHFPARIVRDLDLQAHGFQANTSSATTTGLDLDGRHVVIDNDQVAGVTADDADRYQEYLQQMRLYAGALRPFWLKTMPRIGDNTLAEKARFAHMGLNLRRLGQQEMREFMRIAALPTRDLMDENFDSELLKAALSWDGLLGSKLAPRSPNHPVLAMLYRTADGKGATVAGNVAELIEALRSAATSNGVEIRNNAIVDRILVGSNATGLVAEGVQLANGETLSADRVVSSADPQRTFTKFVGVENLEIGFTNRIRRLRCDGFVAKLHLALDGLPEFTGVDNIDGRMLTAPDMDTIEFAYDDAKYGECSKQPVIEITIPSMSDSSMAPAGQHVLSAHVMYVPYQLKGGWNDAARNAICERAIDTLARYAPGIRKQIIHQEFLTPKDLEDTCRVSGGHWHQTEFALDQLLMMRPTYEAAQYRTPLPGLFLCGAGCHPGGDLTGSPGHNAAAEILR